MPGKRAFILFLLVTMGVIRLCAQDTLKIECATVPAAISQGDEGLLKIKITLHAGVRISSHPEFMIRFSGSEQFSFAKIFFTGSELNLPRIQSGEGVFLDLQKGIEIPFRVSADAFIGRHTIRGEILFTILSADNWYIKSTQTFATVFYTKKGPPPAAKTVPLKKKGELATATLRAGLRSDTSVWFPPRRSPGRSAG